jgi:lipopolysaccharide/colanic/teichoic acid biosynthesis glycosyltransferase
MYFFLTRGQNRVLTKAETFGRLYSCGFEIITEKHIDNHLYFVARKTGAPLFPEKPSYGPLVKLERIGRNGKNIMVYKMRTMHPYAEYLQGYVYEKVGLDNGGKFRNDFRVSNLGKFMRTFWIDELPMLINLFKGELKIFGVRPLSRQYFNLYTRELQERRIRYKPGLIPPFYVDNPQTLEEIMSSEIKYLDAYDKKPFITDFIYFFKALFNIIIKRYRSK